MESYSLSFDYPDGDESLDLGVILNEQRVGDISAVYDCLEILKKEVKRLIYEYQLKDEVKGRDWMYKTVNGIRTIQKCIETERKKMEDPLSLSEVKENLNCKESGGEKEEKDYSKEKITDEFLNGNEDCLAVFFNTDWDTFAPDDVGEDFFEKCSSPKYEKLINSDDAPDVKKTNKRANLDETKSLLLELQEEVAKYQKLGEELQKREEATITMLKCKHRVDKRNLNHTIEKLQNEISTLRAQQSTGDQADRLTRYKAIYCNNHDEYPKGHRNDQLGGSPKSPFSDLKSVRKKLTSVDITPLFSLQKSGTPKQTPRPRPSGRSASSIERWMDHLPIQQKPLKDGNKSLFHKDFENCQLVKQFLDYQSKCVCEAKSSLDLSFLKNFMCSTRIEQKEKENSELMRQLRKFETKCKCRASMNFSFSGEHHIVPARDSEIQPLILF